MPPANPRPRAGRPSHRAAAALTETILDIATALFLERGYEATSLETVAKRARISKRTFYHRFRDKAELFEAVVRRLIDRWRARVEPAAALAPLATGALAPVLQRIAAQILEVALTREALALHRLVLAEAQRFPDLARRLEDYGMSQGAERIAVLLGGVTAENAAWARFAAQHFIRMVLSVPQRRALGFGMPLAADELDLWVSDTVRLFLEGWHPRGR
jgi:AcrR family transcriptional regulator